MVQEEVPWKTIQVGGYYFDFPSDFKLVEEQGIDSYIGRIEGDEFTLWFDYGYYSGDFGPTPEEYLQDSSWVLEAGYQLMEPGREYGNETMPRPKVFSVRYATPEDSCLEKGCDYIAKCQFQNTVFEHPIYLPEETENTTIKIDTVAYQYRRVAVSNLNKGGVAGMYIRDLSDFNASMNSYLALSISADSLDKEQQALVLKIFDTVKPAK
jgi:hypothetical protein